MADRFETPEGRTVRLERPWIVVHFELQDTSTIMTEDGEQVIGRISGSYRRPITDQIVRDHNAALAQPPADDGALGRMREALEDLRTGYDQQATYVKGAIGNVYERVSSDLTDILNDAALSPAPDQDGRDAQESPPWTFAEK